MRDNKEDDGQQGGRQRMMMEEDGTTRMTDNKDKISKIIII